MITITKYLENPPSQTSKYSLSGISDEQAKSPNFQTQQLSRRRSNLRPKRIGSATFQEVIARSPSVVIIKASGLLRERFCTVRLEETLYVEGYASSFEVIRRAQLLILILSWFKQSKCM